MTKQLGKFGSFLAFCGLALMSVSCSYANQNQYYNDSGYSYNQPYGYDQYVYDQSYNGGGNVRPQNAQACPPRCVAPSRQCPPPCPPPCPAPRCAPCPPPCPAPAPCVECKQLVRCKHPNSNQLSCFDFITVRATNPHMCLLGDQYPLDFSVDACADVCDVVVTTHLPDGVTFMKSEPEAIVEGNKLTWNFGGMDKGEHRCAKVLLKCECEGELCACFCATATPVRFCSLLCAKPILVCHKCGPEEVSPCEPVHYTITVSNQGSCTAEEVVITDNIPCELEHSSGNRTLIYKLGSLAPCQTKKVEVCLKAVKRGRACNSAVVTACNADSVSCQWCTDITVCTVEVEKVGPREVMIGKNADYQITVVNTGDHQLTDVIVTDSAPSSTSIVSANGACINGNQAVWRLKELKPGARATFNITLTTCTPGCFTNRVNVDNCQGCRACTEFTTRWKGRPALNVCIADSEDPICIGDRTSYTITVVNQGSEADDNVQVVARFPNELRPVSACGDSQPQVSGNTVTFAPFDNLRPRQTITYRIDAEGAASGDGRVVVEVTSNGIKTPIMQQESTIVN